MDKNIIINSGSVQYVVWFSKDLKLCCNKKVNGKFVLGLDDEDKKVIIDVINSLCVSDKNSYFIRSDVFNGISYNLYYDYDKFLYFTDSFDDSVNSLINLKYNNMPLIYSSYNVQVLKNDNVFRRSIKNGLIKFGVGASVSLMAFSLGTKLYNDTLVGEIISEYISSGYENDISGEISYNELNFINYNVDKLGSYIMPDLEKISNVSNSYSITFDDMKKTLDKNPYVDSEFKEFFSKLDFAFMEDMEYFDSSILNKLVTLKVEYVSESGSSNGRYFPLDNKIIYYNVHDFNEVDPNTALHEIGHVFQNVNTNNICFELSNEVWTREVLRSMVDKGLISSDLFDKDERGNIIYVDGYTDKLFLYYYLIELMDVDTIKRFQWEPNDSTLVSSLVDMSNNDEVKMVHEVLELIDECGRSGYLRLDDEKVIQIRTKLNYFYNRDKGIDIQSDLDVFAFDYAGIKVISSDLNNILVQESNFSNNLDVINLNDVVYYGKSKSFFSDNYQTELYCGLNEVGSDKRSYFTISVDDELKSEFVNNNRNSMKK